MLGRITISALVAIAFLVPVAAGASQKFAGRWKRTTFRVKVTVQSWGEDCGPKPKSYGSSKVVEVDVIAQGVHLIFSKGGMRTDRCMSPNPRLNSVSQKNASGNWSRVCQTPKSDPKFERLESTLKAHGANKLVYSGKSKFDWSLKGDHCVAFLDERRVYVREGAEGEEPPEEKKPKKEKEKPEPEPLLKPGCEEHGPIKRLTLHPKKAQIGPGERICFKAEAIDANNCRFPVSASWTATQDEQEVGGLLSRGGCFSAGATAAESEGTYEITARVEGKTAEATVTVSFPDLGDLLAARLKPTEALGQEADEDAGPGEPTQTGPKPTPPAPPTGTGSQVAETAGDDNTVLLIIVIAAGMVIAVGLLVLALVLRRRPRRPLDLDDEDDDWMDQPAPAAAPRARAEPPPSRQPPDPETKPTRDLREPASGRDQTVVCPECSRSFPAGAKFCPHDGKSLIPPPAGSGFFPKPGSDAGMICPKCHRGYDTGARFCPHDSEKLVPYKEWRNNQREKRR